MVFYVSKDDGAVTAIASASGVPTECDATNAKGDYKIALSATETNADKLRFSGKSGTSNVVVVAQTIYTVPANFTAFSIDSSGLVSLVSAYNFAKGTVAMTESYAADGAAPTPAQALFLIQQHLTEFSIVVTTWTTKKLDGTTTAATFTLNDASAPTSMTRAS